MSSVGWMQQYGTPEDRAALQQYFYTIDTDRSGTIDSSELARSLQMAGEQSDPEYVQLLMKMYSRNGGVLTFDDYVGLVGFMRQQKQTFNQNGSDKMDLASVSRAVEETHRGFPGLGVMMPMVSTLFGQMGGTQSGGISSTQFMLLQMFMSNIRTFLSSSGGSSNSSGLLNMFNSNASSSHTSTLGGAGLNAMLGSLMGGSSTNNSSYSSSSSSAPSGGVGLGGYTPHAQGTSSSSMGGPAGYGQTQVTSSSTSGGYGGPPGYGQTQTSSTPSSFGGPPGYGQPQGQSQSGFGSVGGPPGYGQTQTYTSTSSTGGYGGPAGYGQAQQGGYSGGSYPQTAPQNTAALQGFKPPSGYGTGTNSNAPPGPAFEGVG